MSANIKIPFWSSTIKNCYICIKVIIESEYQKN